MANVKYFILVIACAIAFSYIISFIYCKISGTEDTDTYMKTSRSVCIYENGQYELIDVEEYTVSTLAGMMDSDWNDEMLKVAAVIIRTGIYYQMDMQKDAADQTEYRSCNLINESRLREIRYTDSDLHRIWGNNTAYIEDRASRAVAATVGEVIRYDGEVIMPAYHLVSTGHTVSAEELYGYDIPYLRQVSSNIDQMSDDFSYTVTYSEDRLRKVFHDAAGEEEQVRIAEATQSGYARVINVFGGDVEAAVFKDRLGLPSTNIHIDEQDDGYRIITIGVGDALGLSLYGANVLAENGEKYNSILKYYYTGVTISR